MWCGILFTQRRKGAETLRRMADFSAPPRLCVSLILFALISPRSVFAQAIDPAAWGTDHVGRPVPEFTSGDECLFCHRDVGPAWPTNRHGQTIRQATRESDALKALGQS